MKIEFGGKFVQIADIFGKIGALAPWKLSYYFLFDDGFVLLTKCLVLSVIFDSWAN